MARGAKRGGKGKAKARGRKGKARRRNVNVPEMASMSVKRTLTTGNGFLPNTMYNLMNVALIDYHRASLVAQAYQFYKIKNVKVTWKPLFDSYVAQSVVTGGTASGIGKPNLYYMLDKSGSVQTGITLEGLKAMGARPRQLDEKNLSVSWAPSVLENVLTQSSTVTSLPSKYKISPWLNTNQNVVSPGIFQPSDVDHLGIYWYIDQFANVPQGGAVPPYTIEIEVQFVFKKPLSLNSTGNSVAIPAEYARLNNSPDGIVGGNDGI